MKLKVHNVRILVIHKWMPNFYDMIRVPFMLVYWNGNAFPTSSFSLN